MKETFSHIACDSNLLICILYELTGHPSYNTNVRLIYTVNSIDVEIKNISPLAGTFSAAIKICMILVLHIIFLTNHVLKNYNKLI